MSLDLMRLLKKVSNFKSITGSEPTVLVDLDKTLCEFHWEGIERYDPFKIGPPLPGAVEFIQELNNLAYVGVVTCRNNYANLEGLTGPRGRAELYSVIQKWFRDNGFPSTLSVDYQCLPPHALYISDNAIGVEANGVRSIEEVKDQVIALTSAYEKDRHGRSRETQGNP